jgi:hypothetical protein
MPNSGANTRCVSAPEGPPGPARPAGMAGFFYGEPYSAAQQMHAVASAV